MRSFTVNDGSPQSRWAGRLGGGYSRNDLGSCATDHVRPYKEAIWQRRVRAEEFGHGPKTVMDASTQP